MVRISQLSVEAINTALRKIEEQVGAGGSGLSEEQVASLTASITALQSSLADYVPVTRQINSQALDQDIELDASSIPYDATQSVYDKISILESPFTILGFVDTYADLLLLPAPALGSGYIVVNDETTDGNQWLYVWDGNLWKQVAPFGFNMSDFYIRSELYTKDEVNALQTTQDTATNNRINQATSEAITSAVNQAQLRINTSATASQQYTNNVAGELHNTIAGEITEATSHLVPKTTTINNKALSGDILLSALDIPYKNNVSVSRALDALGALITILGAVDTFELLPVTSAAGDGYVVRNGTHGAYPELYLFLRGSWEYICQLLINVDLYATHNEVENLVEAEIVRATQAEQQLTASLASEVSRSTQIDTATQANLASETLRAQQAEQQLNANIISATQNTLINANNYTDTATQVFIDSLGNKVEEGYPHSFIEELTVIPSASGISLQLDKTNLNEETVTTYITLPLVTDTSPGIMPPTDHQQIWLNEERIQNLESGGVYIGFTYPTFSALNANNPPRPSWINSGDWTLVIADETHTDDHGQAQTTHWIWSDSLGWEFLFVTGSAEVPQFSNTLPGLIRGSTADGYVSAASGAGVVSGWGTVKAGIQANATSIASETLRATTAEGNKADKLAVTPGVFTKVSVNAQGLVSSGEGLIVDDIPTLPQSKITGTEDLIRAALSQLRIMTN